MKIPALRDGLVTILDQAIISATNFLVALLLIRNSAEGEYGVYVLAFAAVLLFTGVQNAIINTPMSILVPQLDHASRSGFIAGLLRRQYLIWLPLCLVIALAGWLLPGAGLQQKTGDVMLVFALSMLLIFLREFLRRAFLTLLTPRRMLRLDVLYSGVYLVLLFIVVQYNSVTARAAIMMMGLAASLAAIAGLHWLHQRIDRQAPVQPAVLARTWHFGRWAVLGVILTWVQNRAFFYILGGLEDTTAVGNIDSLRLLLMPVPIIFTSLAGLLRPKGASLLGSGERQHLRNLVLRYMLGSAGFCVIYTVCIMAAYPIIAEPLLKQVLPNARLLLMLWGVLFLLQSIRAYISALCHILQQFDILFYVSCVSAPASVAIAWWSISTFGGIASLAGPIAGEFLFIVVLAVGASAKIRRVWHAHPQARA